MQIEQVAEKNVLVIGLGMSGQSAAQFLLAQGAFVQGVDRQVATLVNLPSIQMLQEAGLTLASEEAVDLASFDFIVLSPGVPLNHPLVQAAQKASIPLVGEIELGCQFAKNPMIGITGTNGKTTVTLLVTHVLNHCHYSAHALGNVSIPFTAALLSLPPGDQIVLELSSYQLETLYQPCLDAAVILNITPDHLDRYLHLEAYAKAKCEIERCLKQGSYLYIEENTWQQYQSFFHNDNIRLYGYLNTSFIYTDLENIYLNQEKVLELPSGLKHKKSHDLENFLAAFALCAEKKVSGSDFIKAYASFKKPSHRIEFIAEQKGIKYYDDSKGTNIEAVIRAVQSLEGKITLIAGGVDKGFSYRNWIKEFDGRVKLICAIGQAAAKIQSELEAEIPVMIFDSLEQAVNYAANNAQRGENVLLSPGCASFDMFKDYAHRGKEFQRIVHQLENLPHEKKLKITVEV